jgi:hypothetical protein
MGQKIKQTCMSVFELSMTSNTFRAMVETANAEAYANGSIDSITKQHIHNINGHTSTTAQVTYVKNQRLSDGINGQLGFLKMCQQSNRVNGNESVTNQLFEDQRVFEELKSKNSSATMSAPIWGSAHPHIGSTSTRIPWVDAEVNTVKRVAVKLLKQNEYNGYTIASKTLSVIMSNYDKYGSIFHKRHILNPDRFKTGIKKAEKRSALLRNRCITHRSGKRGHAEMEDEYDNC